MAYEKVCRNMSKKNAKQLASVNQKEFNRGYYTSLFKIWGVHWGKWRKKNPKPKHN